MIQKGKQEMLTSGSQTVLLCMSIPREVLGSQTVLLCMSIPREVLGSQTVLLCMSIPREVLGVISATLLPMNDILCSFLSCL